MPGNRMGQEVEDWSGEIAEVATLEAPLPATEVEESGALIPVFLQTRITEIGAVELFCVARDDDRQWKLEFRIREEEGA